MNVPFTGALSGLLATAPVTLVMKVLHQRLPRDQQYPLPPYEITTGLAGKADVEDQLHEDERRNLSLAAHFGYGAAMGVVYAGIGKTFKENRMPPIPRGILFGLAVWAGNYLGLLPALNILRPATEHPRQRNALMIAAHIVWGAVLGVLVDQLSDEEKSDD